MADEESGPPRPDSPLVKLTGQDLSEMGLEELAERIEALEGEIRRVRELIESKKGSRLAAESVFE